VRVWGLTGNIACGKSTVEDLIRNGGIPVIDADRVARTIVEPGQPALAEIEELFGTDVLDEEGRLNRPALGAIVFSDPASRRQLEAITHPRIHARTAELLSQLAQDGTPLAVVSAALMIEAGSYRLYDGLIVVTCPETLQLERLRARDGFTEQDARARTQSQMAQASKAALADVLIDNGGNTEATAVQVRAWLTHQDGAT
jgi:dephospho-CoA kinase